MLIVVILLTSKEKYNYLSANWKKNKIKIEKKVIKLRKKTFNPAF